MNIRDLMATIDSLQEYDAPMVEEYTPIQQSVNPLVAAMRELREDGVIDSVDAHTIYSAVQGGHREPDDFVEGDIGDRIYWFDDYKLTSLPIASLNLDEHYVDEDLVDDYIEHIKYSPKTMPPIVYDPIEKSIIDGIHRANAYAKLGYENIPAYSGLTKSDSYGQRESDNEEVDEGADGDHQTGGSLGLPFPGTYEQEYGNFKSKGQRRMTTLTTEALDSSYPYEFKNNAYYFATEQGNEYKVSFNGDKKVEVSFVTRDKTGNIKDTITGTGDAQKVFGTVIEIVKDYVGQHNPEIILFAAISSAPSRVKLYNTLANKVSKVLPAYAFAKTLKNAMFTTFYLTRDNIKVPKLTTAKNAVSKTLDKVFEETTTLTQLYGDNKPERNETIWDYGTMIWDDPFEIDIISPRALDMYLCNQYNVEFIEDLFERMSEEQHEIVDNYINDPNLSNKIIVLDNGHIVDGNHRAIAAALTKRPIKYIDIGEEEEA